MSKLVLLLVLSGFITYSVVNLTQNKNTTQATDNSVITYSQTNARNIANSTIQMLMSKVADNYDWRVESPVTIQYSDGETTYSVIDETFDGEDLIKYSVSSTSFGVNKNITAYTDKFPFVIPSLRGAITANNPVLSNGGLTIDGRNHTSSGDVIPETGSYAVWTTGTFTQQGSSDLGGTNERIDYVPSNPADPNVILENQTWPGGFPGSPDQVMGGSAKGFPEGTLKSVAQSSINGSQYVTNPASLSGDPLSGVTYLELTGSKEKDRTWQSMDLTGSGILIVHNTSRNSIIKNVNAGTFKGIIIADDMVHIHSTIIGSLIILTPSPSSGNTVGNSNGKVLYSTEAMSDALTGTNLEKRMFNYGFGNNRLYVKHWFE